MRTLLGIDEGTSATKVVLFDLELRPLMEVRRAKRTTSPQAGHVEQDAEEILAGVVDAVAEVLDAHPDAEIVGCGLDHQGESVLAWDPASGRPLSPVITWQDKRSQTFLDGLSQADRELVVARSGLPIDPYFSAGKIAWLIGHGLPADARIGTVDAFLCDRLGAGWATDLSTASRTQLSRVGSGTWDGPLCDVFGVAPDRLPPLRDSAGALGELSHPRWRTTLPLTAQVVDQQAALAGAGCVTPGRVKATYGTGVFVLAFAGDRRPDDALSTGVLPTVAWRIAGRVDYALDGGVFSAGSLLEWLSGDLGLFSSPEALTGLAASVADADGVRVLPALSGLGAPWWNPDARAVVSGLHAGTRPAHVARGVVDGLCHRVCDIVEAMSRFVPVQSVRVDGGLTNSGFLVQRQADLLGVPVEQGAVDATVTGVAALAAVGAGVWPTVESIAEHVQSSGRVMPRAVDDERGAWRAFVAAAGAL